MKKGLIVLMAFLMCAGFVYAESYSSIVLKTTVEGSGEIEDPSVDPDAPIEDDGPDFNDDNLVGYIYWEPVFGTSTKYKLGSESAIDLRPIAKGQADENYSKGFDLDGTATDAADSIAIYVYTGSNVPEGGTPDVTVTYSSEGWALMEDGSATDKHDIPVVFSTTTQNVKGSDETDIITVSAQEATAAGVVEGVVTTAASQAIYFNAEAVTNTNGKSILTALTMVSWAQDTKPQAGDYQATIAIDIAVNE